MSAFRASLNTSGLSRWAKKLDAAATSAARMAGRDGQRSMRAEANRQIRARKALKLAGLSDLLVVLPPRGTRDALVWPLFAKAKAAPIIAYSGVRRTSRGISVEINVGRRVIIAHAFKATMRSGHEGVFIRYGAPRIMPVQSYRGRKRYAGQKRQAIRELYTTRAVDAFSDATPAIMGRGVDAFHKTFRRVLPLEIAKRSAT